MEIEKVRELSSAGRLYLIILMGLGHEALVMPKTQIMAMLGVETERTYYKIRKELVDRGILTRMTDEYTLSPSYSISSANVPLRLGNPLIDRLNDKDSSSIYLSISQSGEPNQDPRPGAEQPGERDETGRTVLPGHVQIGQYTVQNGQSSVENGQSGSKSDSLRSKSDGEGPNRTVSLDDVLPRFQNVAIPLADRCIEADGLDGSGNKHSTTSAYYVRRRVQVTMVQEAWKHFFPKGGKLMDAEAKRFLAFCEDSAEILYEELERLAERAKNIQFPYKYVRAALENRVNEGPREPRPVSPAKPRPTYKPQPKEEAGKPDYVTEDELYKPTEEELEQRRKESEAYAKLFDTDTD